MLLQPPRTSTIMVRVVIAIASFGVMELGAAPGGAQTAPPVPTATSVPWRPRPMIIVDPRAYLASPTPRPSPKRRASPKPHPHPTSPRRRPAAAPTPETFERHDTQRPPATER